MRIAICDDSQKEREQFISALNEWDPAKEPECFSTGASFLDAARRVPAFDIAFLDIYILDENGVDIARELQKISPGTGIVFVTISHEHAVDAFSLHALHYLVKPVTAKGIEEAFCRLRQIVPVKRPMISLTVGRSSYTVYLDEVYYVQSVNHAKEIFLENGRMLRVWMSFEELEPKLDDRFLKLNRGTIVNMEHIVQMGIDICILRDGTRLGFTRRKSTMIRALYDNYLFSRLSGGKGFQKEAGL